VRVAPGLLGQGGTRQYFVAFTTPAEARGLGGFMGNWAVLTATDGNLELTRDGRVADLLPRAGDPPRTLDAPADYVDRYGPLHPEAFPGDVTASPDFPSVAQALAGIYAQVEGGGPVDGVLAIDPYGLAAMLEITGPITVTGQAEPLTAANAADYLLRRQYEAYDTRQERIDVLDEASRATFDAFIHAGDLQPTRLAAVMAPPVAEGRIVASSDDPAEQAFIERLGLGGAFPAADGGDFFAVVTQNGSKNKIDAYLHRSVEYRPSFDPETGALEANVTIRLRNDAPAGLPDYVIGNDPESGRPDGTNWTWLNVYSPHDLASFAVDGRPVGVGTKQELGRFVYQTYVAVPAGATVEVTMRLTGTIDRDDEYRLRWYQQPLVHPDEVEVAVSIAPPWYVDDPDAPAGTVPLVSGEPDRVGPSREDGELVLPLRRVDP
jgi:hypothetical protein